MTLGPLIGAGGSLMMLRMRAHTAYFTEMLPGVIVFGVGLSATVSPLTAAILGDIDQRHAGIGSAINNAISRVAGLLAIAALGRSWRPAPAASLDRRRRRGPRPARPDVPRRSPEPPLRYRRAPRGLGVGGTDARAVRGLLEDASVSALHTGLLCMAGLLNRWAASSPRPASVTGSPQHERAPPLGAAARCRRDGRARRRGRRPRTATRPSRFRSSAPTISTATIEALPAPRRLRRQPARGARPRRRRRRAARRAATCSRARSSRT